MHPTPRAGSDPARAVPPRPARPPPPAVQLDPAAATQLGHLRPHRPCRSPQRPPAARPPVRGSYPAR
uniref:Uncharacterized protein n=1 Tax=Arundo donax TaxID=35708 RepID=A0A0A9GP46_ARUDO